MDRALVRALSRHGFDVAVDVGHHDAYATPLRLLEDAARRLHGLPAWLVGVHCPLEVIVARRETSPEGAYASVRDPDGHIAEAVVRWQEEVHRPGEYDLVVDTAENDPLQCAEHIRRHLDEGSPPSALHRLRSEIDR